ncbi:MAG: DUF411 domain-containing protein [Burkholderiales bacterium]|nr:DUF411 domain-containing protein [Burkholderiales bacterium]
MKRVLSLAGIAAALVIGVSCTQAPADTAEITVYKTSTCGCCKDWIRHLRANGFTVNAYDVQNLDQIARQNGVAPQLRSCHTARVGGYVVEGHVPAQDIKRLLAEKPDVTGLAVPGMPQSAPGMDLPGNHPYNVYTFKADGSTSVYARY